MLILYALASFLLGSIPNAYIAGKLLKNIDIRQHGSGNAGATNVVRVLGKGPGYVVFLLDFLKGVIPVAAYTFLFPGQAAPLLLRFAFGICAVFGHMFTPFLSFKGGKGVATGAGALCAAFPAYFILSFVVWITVFFITRIVSISSLVSVSVLPVAALAVGEKMAVFVVLLSCAGLVFWSHRSNISRLIKGEEKVFRKKTK